MQRELPEKTSLNAQQVAIGHRVGQVVFQAQQSSHYRLKHDVRATLNLLSEPFVFSVGSDFQSSQRCLGVMRGATPKLWESMNHLR